MVKNSLLVLISICIAIFLAEIGLRVVGIAYPEFNRLDTELGWSPRPNTEGYHAMEGRTWMRINKAGFRDADHQFTKPKDVFRIIVLGDSFAEGREVPLNGVFWKIAESGLQTCKARANKKYEIISLAVNGYGTAQQLIALNRYAWRYQPDAVLLAIFTGNDIWNNARSLDGHRDRPYFVFKNNKLILDDTYLKTDSFKSRKFWADLKHGAYNQLRTLQVARQAYKAIRYAKKFKKLPIEGQLAAGLNNGIYQPPSTTAWKNAWQVTEALIKKMNQSIQQKSKVKFWIASLSTPAQVYPDKNIRDSIAKKLNVSNLDYPDERLADLTTSMKVPYFPLAKHLRLYADTNKKRLHGNSDFAGGHWNELGHRIAGKRLADLLCRPS